jgi:hypothetical protein
MLFFESDPGYKNAPPQIIKIVEALKERGFTGFVNDDLELINLELSHPLIEKDGKILYKGIVVGYPRGIDPRKDGPVTMEMVIHAGTNVPAIFYPCARERSRTSTPFGATTSR